MRGSVREREHVNALGGCQDGRPSASLHEDGFVINKLKSSHKSCTSAPLPAVLLLCVLALVGVEVCKALVSGLGSTKHRSRVLVLVLVLILVLVLVLAGVMACHPRGFSPARSVVTPSTGSSGTLQLSLKWSQRFGKLILELGSTQLEGGDEDMRAFPSAFPQLRTVGG